MRKLSFLAAYFLMNFIWGQCTTYGSATPVNFAGSCNETSNRNHNGNGTLTISGDLSWSSGTFFVRGPVVVTGSLTFTGSSSMRILVNGSLQVASGGTVTALAVDIGADGSLTIDAGGTMTATDLVNDVSGPAVNTITVNGSLSVSGTLTNNGNGVIAGAGSLTGDVSDGGTSTFSGTYDGSCTGGCFGVLPVELVSFTVSEKNNSCELRWSTASELNNDGFVVQRRSTEEDEFRDIGYVSGHGTTSEPHEYQFTDRVTGSYYYRLKQVDYDGQFEYSTLVFFSNQKLGDPVIIFQDSQGRIAFRNWPGEIRQISLISMRGESILSASNLNGALSKEMVSRALTSAGEGIYVLRIATPSRMEELKLRMDR